MRGLVLLPFYQKCSRCEGCSRKTPRLAALAVPRQEGGVAAGPRLPGIGLEAARPPPLPCLRPAPTPNPWDAAPEAETKPRLDRAGRPRPAPPRPAGTCPALPPRRAVPCRAAGGAAGGAAAEPRFAGAVSPPAPSVAAAASDRSASAPALPAAEGCPRATGASRPGGGGSVPGRPAGDFAAPGRAPGAAAGPGARSRPAPSGRKLGSARWRRAAAHPPRPRGDRGRSCRWHRSRPSSSLPFHRSSTQIPPRRPLAALIPVSEPIQREAGASGANTLIPPPRPRGRAPTAAAACGHPSAPAGSLPAATLGCGSDPPAIISDLCGLGARGRSRSLAVAWGVNSVLYAVGLTGVGLRGEPPVLPRGGICSPQESLTSAIALT